MSHLIEKTRGVNGTNLQKEMEVGERDKESRELFSYESLVQDGRFISFVELIRSEGEVLFTEAGREYVVLKPSDFENIDQRIGFCLFANLCFGTDMGFAGTNVIDRNEGRVKVMMEGGTPVAFLGEKKVEDPFGRLVYYLDIVGVLPGTRGKGRGSLLGKVALEYEVGNTDKDIVFISRTQNPVLVGMARRMLPEGVDLVPFWTEPGLELIESVNWFEKSGLMSRNSRSDTHFDAYGSFIHWGAYGFKGDGTTWENMIKKYAAEIDWESQAGREMRAYLVKQRSSLEEALIKGHAFIIAAYINKLNK